jgi:glycosyltransferase involved in cell wall biosynthesis
VLPSSVRAFPASRFEERQEQRPFDLAIYQMGNSREHLYMYPFLAGTSGLLVLHDLVLHHSRAKAFLESEEARAYAGNPASAPLRDALTARLDEYRAEVEYAYPGRGRKVAEVHLGTVGDLLPYAYPLFRLPVESSRVTACHNEYMAARIRSEVPGAEVVRIPMMMKPQPVAPGEVQALRGRLGLAPDDLVVGSFGLLTREKRIETVARAVARLRLAIPKLRLMLVGPVPDRPALDRMLAGLRLATATIVTGRVPFSSLAAHIEAVDIVAHLRYPTARETSAALLRVLAQGRPAAVSDLAHLADVPKDAVVRLGFDEEDDLVSTLERLAGSPERRRALGGRAAAFVRDAHSPSRCREAYLAAIEKAAARAPASPVGAPGHWARRRI